MRMSSLFTRFPWDNKETHFTVKNDEKNKQCQTNNNGYK